MADTLQVLGFAVSLRQASFNRALLRAAVEAAPPGIAIRAYDIADVPLYNGDVEAAGDPPGVTAFKDAIRGSDGLLIVTPEYNYGVPGVLKNAIDWASRPPGKSALDRKPAAIVGATPGPGGTYRGQYHLRMALQFPQMRVMPMPEVMVSAAHEKFDGEGRLTDDATRERLGKVLEAFAEWIRTCHAAQ